MIAKHSVSLPASGLTVGETSAACFVEGCFNDGTNSVVVDLLVVGSIVESQVKVEVVLLNVLGEVDFKSRN